MNIRLLNRKTSTADLGFVISEQLKWNSPLVTKPSFRRQKPNFFRHSVHQLVFPVVRRNFSHVFQLAFYAVLFRFPSVTNLQGIKNQWIKLSAEIQLFPFWNKWLNTANSRLLWIHQKLLRCALWNEVLICLLLAHIGVSGWFLQHRGGVSCSCGQVLEEWGCIAP